MATYKPRKDPTKGDYARTGSFVLAGILVVLFLVYLQNQGTFGGPPQAAALVKNAGGALRSGSDVKIDGVIVGRVTDISRDGGDIRVDFSVGEDNLDDIPGNVVARILPANVFGTNYLDLAVHGTPSEEHLQAGAEVPPDTTQDTLELQKALDNIDRLTKALGPKELAEAIGSAAEALDGRGAKIGGIIDTVDSYLVRLTPQMGVVRSDLQMLAANLDLVNDIAPDLLDATDDALVTMNTIVEKQGQITALITGGTSLVQTSNEFLSSNQKQLVRSLDNGVRLMDILYDNRRAGITNAINTNIRLGRELPGIVREGFAETTAGRLTFEAPPFYGPGDRPTYGGR